jgi:capsular polysaccharide biosynthesis protein
LTADLANAIGTAGVEYVSGIQAIYELRYLDPAQVEPEPVSPNHLINIALSIIIGFSGGMAFLILREILAYTFSGEKTSSSETAPRETTSRDLGSIERGHLPSASPLDPFQ